MQTYRIIKAMLLALCLTVSALMPVQVKAAAAITVTVNSEKINFATPPQNINGRILVQIRAIVEKLGCKVEWDAPTNTVYINQFNVPLSKSAPAGGGIKVYVNNKPISFPDQKPINFEGHVMIPSRAVVEKLGCSVQWVPEAQTQVITSQGKTPVIPTAQSEPTSTPELTIKPADTPETIESEQKIDTTVYITNSGGKYHSSGCQYLKKSKIPIGLSDAKDQGYSPCSKCGPPR
jgi:phage baseplate assembly protein gpV